jgi:hypothetical protein
MPLFKTRRLEITKRWAEAEGTARKWGKAQRSNPRKDGGSAWERVGRGRAWRPAADAARRARRLPPSLRRGPRRRCLRRLPRRIRYCLLFPNLTLPPPFVILKLIRMYCEKIIHRRYEIRIGFDLWKSRTGGGMQLLLFYLETFSPILNWNMSVW